MWQPLQKAVITHDGEVIPYLSPSQFIKEVTERRLIVFVFRLLDKREFSPLDELRKDKRVKLYASRTGGCTGVYIKSKYSAWIVERRTWDDSLFAPDVTFLDNVHTMFKINSRCAATPGALGEKKIMETLPKGTRYSRPSVMLRQRLQANKVGGRSDTMEVKREYAVLFEKDINGSYPYCSTETIDPGETPTGFGHSRYPIADSDLVPFYSYYCLAHISLPIDAKPPKFGPVHMRKKKALLEWPTKPGCTFEGWYWKEELDRARRAGYKVTVYKGYGWYRSSNWLEKWANTMWQMRLDSKANKAVEGMVKRETVAAIGRFGMAPETCTLVDEEHYQDGDLPIVVSNPVAEESGISDYYIHIEPDPESNRLNHIAAYIVMKGRVLLYDLMLEEEQSGNTVVASNHDSLYSLQPTQLTQALGTQLGQLKERVIVDASIEAPRWLRGLRDGVLIDHRPGSDRRYRKELISSHKPQGDKPNDKHQHTKRQHTKKNRSGPVQLEAGGT